MELVRSRVTIARFVIVKRIYPLIREASKLNFRRII